MQIDLLLKIKSDPKLYQYLKHHSYWYKTLRRNPNQLTELTEEMKKEYKLTMSDKINDLSNKLMLVRTFLNMMQ